MTYTIGAIRTPAPTTRTTQVQYRIIFDRDGMPIHIPVTPTPTTGWGA